MTNFTIEKLGLSSFLIYRLQDGEKLDHEQLGRRIPGMLPCTAFERDGSVFLRYDLLFETSLEKLTTAPFTKEQLSGFLQSVCDTFTAAEEAGLSPRKFVLDSDHIYHDNFSNRLVFIYLPLKSNVFEKLSLRQFFRELLAAVHYGENEDPHFFIQLHNYLATCSEVNLEQLGKVIADVDEDAEEAFYRPGSEAKTTISAGQITSEYSSSKKDKKTGQKLEIEEEVQYKRITRTELGENDSLLNRAAAFGGGTSINIMPKVAVDPEEEGTTVLGVVVQNDDTEDEGTTALGISPSSSRKPFLVAVGSTEKIMITNDFFRIGRDPAVTDYTSKNKVVGRVHAHIISVGGEYFFEDNQSRNGSYINGIKLTPLTRVKIKHEDKIKLANEEYEFRLF